MRMAAVCLLLWFAACKFEPLLGPAPRDANISDAGRDAALVDGDATSEPDAAPDATIDDDAAIDDSGVVVDAGLDGGLFARTIYRATAGGGELSSARHRATIVIGGSTTIQTATSAAYRVTFGGGTR